MSDPVKQHGFTAVPANPETVFQDANLKAKGCPVAIPVSETPTPATPLARRVDEYCRKNLPKPVYLHSLRVYHLGLAMKRYVAPDWEFSDETYFLACLLHDIGGTPENLRATFLSHEFFGGILALDLLQKDSAGGNAVASKPQAESVAEAIIRHQNLCQTGSLTCMGQILQLATIFDNTGAHSHLVHGDTVQDAIKHYPRTGWSSCFASVVKDETTLKPWAHTTAIDGFQEKILGNPYRKYD